MRRWPCVASFLAILTLVGYDKDALQQERDKHPDISGNVNPSPPNQAPVAASVAQVSASNPSASRLAACRESGAATIATMKANYAIKTETADGWIVIQIGKVLPAERAERFAHIYADADACASGTLRQLEFQDQNERVFARANPLRGIRMVD